MGFKLRGFIRCGRCRQPRGIRHTCVARFGARTRKHRVQSPVTWECANCHKPRGLRHTCGNSGDFRKRKRKAKTAERQQKRKEAKAKQTARRKHAQAGRRARDKARKQAAKTRKPRQQRPRGDSHEPGTCGDRDCPRYGCKSYWAGMDDCPLPHNG